MNIFCPFRFYHFSSHRAPSSYRPASVPTETNMKQVWSSSDFQLIRTLAGHEGKVIVQTLAFVGPTVSNYLYGAALLTSLKCSDCIR